jgi:hypothetical protein
MAGPSGTTRIKIIHGCSRVVMGAGAVVFLIGGKFLHEIRHLNLMNAEAVAIIGGVLLMLLGAGIGMAGKKSSPKH